MGKISHWLKITCQDTSPLVSEMMDHDLPLGKRLRVWLHLAICKMCKNCQSHFLTIRSMARSLGEEGAGPTSSSALSVEAKEKIKRAMKSPN